MLKVILDSYGQSDLTSSTCAFYRDRMGRRVEMCTEKDGTETLQRFVYANYLCIQQLRGTDNALFHSYVWDPTEPIATRPLVFIPSGGEVSYYFHDGNKNVSDLVPASGAPIHYSYTPFGVPTASAPSENPFRFSSEVYDKPLGLIYYNYRHYNSNDGRWGRRDPKNEYGNGYLFVANQVINQKDSLGQITIPWNKDRMFPISSYDPTFLDKLACPVKCFEGQIVQLVRVWSCKRSLANFAKMIGPLFHQYLCCDGVNRNCYGVQMKTSVNGQERKTERNDLILPEVDPSGECEVRCIMPSEKERACNGTCRMPTDYNLFSCGGMNCQDWVKSVTTTQAHDP